MSNEADNAADVVRPETCLPKWDVAELPTPTPLSWSRWTTFIGPGIVMMGLQIGGGEWLLGPDMTARYGAGMMWIATIAIVVQVFYNFEAGRYALYTGEPIFTGFMRTFPGPLFWMPVFVVFCIGMLIPGLSTQAAAIVAAIYLGRPAGAEDGGLVMAIAYASFILVLLPLFVGGKVYNMLQAVMTTKVLVVLGFCTLVGICFVDAAHWLSIFLGFFKFGSLPVAKPGGGEELVNVFSYFWNEGSWPVISMANIAVVAGFAGYAGGGGLSNSLYSNYVRDKGWGMGSLVGAIPSAVGGRDITLSHIGKVFPVTPESLKRWKGWWRYILVDQLVVWMPGCFVGMALPSLISMQFAQHSDIFRQASRSEWAQPVISADGMRHAPNFSPGMATFFWLLTLCIGLLVLLPSQMSIAEDVCRRWTDVLWSGSRWVRRALRQDQVKLLYYGILFAYALWSLIAIYIFQKYGTPKLMTLVISNLNNVSLGLTAFHLLWINCKYLPHALRPRWYQRSGLIACGVFNLGLCVLVFVNKQWPMILELLGKKP